MNIGLLTNVEGYPVAIETFPGNAQDQVTVKGQVKQLVNEFNVKDVVFVGDRGMLTQKCIKEVNEKGFKTTTALTHLQMQDLLSRGIIKTSLFKINEYPEVKDPINPNRSQTMRIGAIEVPDVISTPDEEQDMLLKALCVNL